MHLHIKLSCTQTVAERGKHRLVVQWQCYTAVIDTCIFILYIFNPCVNFTEQSFSFGIKHCGWICWPQAQIIQMHRTVLNSRICLSAHAPSHPWFHVPWWAHACLWGKSYNHEITWLKKRSSIQEWMKGWCWCGRWGFKLVPQSPKGKI